MNSRNSTTPTVVVTNVGTGAVVSVGPLYTFRNGRQWVPGKFEGSRIGGRIVYETIVIGPHHAVKPVRG